MKRGVLINLLVICVAFLISCSTAKVETLETSSDTHLSENFEAVLSGISELNDIYGCSFVETKSPGRDFFHQVADALGGYYASEFCFEIGLVGGSIAGSPLFGVFAGGVCGALGGMAGSALASWIYDEVCNSAGIDLVVPVGQLPDQYEVYTCSYLNKTYGSVHNGILSGIESNRKKYIDTNGNLLIDELFCDALSYEENICGDVAIRDSAYIFEMKSFCKDLYSSLLDSQANGLTESQMCYRLFDLLRDKGFSEEQVLEIKALNEALLPCISLAEETVPSYENAFFDIVEYSGLDFSEKESLKTAGSVYIHSCQYWY